MERDPHQPDQEPSELDSMMIGDRSLRQWHTSLTTDQAVKLIREYGDAISAEVRERLELDEEPADDEDLSVPTPGRQFGNPRDAALHALWRGAWTQASGGAAGSATGPFARLSNSQAELDDVANAFEEELAEIGVEPAQLLGDFLLAEISAANLGVVISFTDEDALVSAFDALKQAHNEWKMREA